MADQTPSDKEVNNFVQEEVVKVDDGVDIKVEEKQSATVVDEKKEMNDGPSTSHDVDGAVANEEDPEGDDDAVVTLGDVVDEQERMKADADALFGGQDHTVCTYPEGYKSRQPLYACKTCANESGETAAAVCLGCSLSCHDGHQLFELYTKRAVCCDCGNSKFANKCTLYSEKVPLNARNSYNHNYRGLYCSCKRPYPDPEDPISDQMVQCIACEDWFHTRHLSKSKGVLQSSEFAEMICPGCVERLPFLKRYRSLIPQLEAEESAAQIDVESSQTTSQSTETKKCLLADSVSDVKEEASSSSDDSGEAIFWPDFSWRTKLCRCSQCDAMYDKLNVQFIVDSDDTLAVYEQRAAAAKDPAEEGEDELVKALVENIDRGVAVEMIHGYNSLKDKLSKYLKRFADEGKVVQEGDINAFFTELRENEAVVKRPRLMPPSSCH